MASDVVLRLTGLSKEYSPGPQAVSNVSLDIGRGAFFSLLGPSGCGKSTLLRMIAGLETPSNGEIHLSGKNITSLPPYRRNVNTVFQSYALFPHLTVRGNVEFGWNDSEAGKFANGRAHDVGKTVSAARDQAGASREL